MKQVGDSNNAPLPFDMVIDYSWNCSLSQARRLLFLWWLDREKLNLKLGRRPSAILHKTQKAGHCPRKKLGSRFIVLTLTRIHNHAKEANPKSCVWPTPLKNWNEETTRSQNVMRFVLVLAELHNRWTSLVWLFRRSYRGTEAHLLFHCFWYPSHQLALSP